MSNVIYAQLILQVGAVCFYEAKPSTLLFGKPSYFWKYSQDMEFRGPFNSLLECGQHFDHSMRAPPSMPPSNVAQPGTVEAQPLPKNVINVDFITKRRLK